VAEKRKHSRQVAQNQAKARQNKGTGGTKPSQSWKGIK